MKLALFDIDGTLLHTGGASRAAMLAAVRSVFPAYARADDYDFVGKTDLLILEELLTLAGADDREREDNIADVVRRYQEFLPVEMNNYRLQVLPGVPELLAILQRRPDVELGLLTGNLKTGAYTKLRAASLDRYFPFGAFGDDHRDRNLLPAVAVTRAEAHTGRTFRPTDVLVVGDGVRDIRCARFFGAIAVAVATGYNPKAALVAEKPDFLYDDLADPDRFQRDLL